MKVTWSKLLANIALFPGNFLKRNSSVACVLTLHSFPSSHLEHDPVLEGPAAVLLKQRRKVKVQNEYRVEKENAVKAEEENDARAEENNDAKAKDANDDRADDTIDGWIEEVNNTKAGDSKDNGTEVADDARV